MSLVGVSDRQVGQYDGPYRRMIVEMITNKNRKVSDVARVFKIPAITIYKWVQEFNEKTKLGFPMKEEKIEGIADRVPVRDAGSVTDAGSLMRTRQMKFSEEEKTKWVEKFLKERETVTTGPASFIEENGLTSYFYEWVKAYKEKNPDVEVGSFTRRYFSMDAKKEWVAKYMATHRSVSKETFLKDNNLPHSFYEWCKIFANDKPDMKAARAVEEEIMIHREQAPK